MAGVPEFRSRAVDGDISGTMMHLAGWILECPLENNGGQCGVKIRFEFRRRGEIIGKLFTEEARDDERVIDVAETIEHQRAEAAVHRIADEQRTGQDGSGGGDAQRDGKVRTPVKGETAQR